MDGKFHAIDLKKLRVDRGLTQVQVAFMLSTNQCAISKLERRAAANGVKVSTLVYYLRGIGAEGAKIAITYEDGSYAELRLF